MRRQSFLLLACFTALILMGCEKNEQAGFEMPAIPVTAAPPVIKDLTIYVDSIGTLQAAVSMDIRPQVSGQLAKVLVKEGEWVNIATPLFQIDPKSYAIKVQESEAQLAMDQADYQGIVKKIERFKELVRQDLVAQTEWDDLNVQAEKAQASLRLNEARLNAAKLDLERCLMTSPTSGRVGKLDVHPGSLISAGQAEPLATIVTLDPLVVEFTVTEKEFPRLSHDNAPLEMIPLCGFELCSKGTVTFIDNQFDPKTGLLMIRGQVANPDHTLRPGQSMKVKFPVGISPNAKLIPQKAIRYNQEGPYVYIVQADQTIALRPIILGMEEGKDQVVLQGIDPEEIVVIEGHLRLSPGFKVEIKS